MRKIQNRQNIMRMIYNKTIARDNKTPSGAGEYRVIWKAVTSSRLDTTALKKALPDVAARFMKSTTSRRFCVA